jgi:hypothetical protein
VVGWLIYSPVSAAEADLFKAGDAGKNSKPAMPAKIQSRRCRQKFAQLRQVS